MLFSGSQVNEVALSDSAANYDRILIRYKDSDGRVCPAIIAKNGESFSFVSIVNTQVGTYIKEQRNTLTGNKITRTGAWQRTLMSGTAESGLYFYVVEVVGYKRP